MTAPRCCHRCGTGLPEPTPAICAACRMELLEPEAIAALRQPVQLVPILCPRCRTEVATVADGPGVFIVELGEAEERVDPGDNAARCPRCEMRIFWRVLLTRAA